MIPSPRYLVLSAGAAHKVPGGARVIAANEHVRERLVQSGLWRRADVAVLDLEPATREAFVEAADFERQKYESYLPIVAGRLNRIHRVAKSADFWGGVVGLTLLMHVSNCRRVFSLVGRAKDEGIDHVVGGAEAFVTPANEANFRTVFQYAESADDQLFAALEGQSLPEAPASPPPRAAAPVSWLRRAAAKIYRVTALLAAEPLLIPQELVARAVALLRPPTLIATHCFWPRPTKRRLEILSRGRVRYEDVLLSYARARPDITSAARAALAEAPPDADPFDEYCFGTLRWAAPTSWCEDFAARQLAASRWLDERPSIRFIANESLDEETSLVLGLARDRGIRVLYCEHNYLQHQFVGHIVWLLERQVDEYLTLGWYRPKYAKLKPAGSLYAWTVPPRSRKTIDLLFVAGVAMVRAPMTSAGYGEAGEHARSYFRMTGTYLDRLSPATLARMYYKDYPTDRRAALGLHALEDGFLDGYVDRLGRVDRTGRERTASLISRSRLVVVNYLSTPYNEALLSGVPTIILFNAATFHLEADERDFFDELIAAGIFQTNPAEAARMTESILDDPMAWWRRPEVQRARERYLARNFGRPETLERYLLDAAASVPLSQPTITTHAS